MQRKLNEDFIDSYCEKFAVKVTADFFQEGKEVISGKEILTVTPSKQVNFFVIKLLFRYWQEETKKLESPFFNYKHDEVRQAMIQFMNVLSQHIEINRTKFELLLNHAVKDTIYLVVAPEAYIEIDLESRGVDKINDKSIEGTIKYLRVHKKEISSFLGDMKGLTIDDVIDELPEEFDEFDTNAAVEEECKLLAEVLEIDAEKVLSDDPDIDDFDEDDLFEPGEEDLVDERPTPRNTAPDAQAESDIQVSSEDDSMEEENIDDEENASPAAVEAPSDNNDIAFSSEDDDTEEVVEDISISSDADSADEEEIDIEEEKPTVDPPIVLEDEDMDDLPEKTVNEQFEKTEETVADHLESSKKGGSLLEMISVNSRYMFIQELFNNDKNEFENALFELEEYQSFDESVEFLVQGYAKHNEWNMQSDEVKELLKVLFRRFR
ncbi:MAG: hypothetical protein AB8B73_14005 [Ekhidna sp.]